MKNTLNNLQDVQVDFYEEDRIKFIERELGLVEQQVIRYWKLLEEIIKAKDIDEANELIAVNNLTLENGVGSIKPIMETCVRSLIRQQKLNLVSL